MNEMIEIRNWIMNFFGLGVAQAEDWAHRTMNGLKWIFFYSLGVSLFLILAGFGINDSGVDGTWIINTGAAISFITALIALFIYMGPAWAILLILPKTNENTQKIFKGYVLPLILWISVINMSFLILSTNNWGFSDAIIFIFAVTVTGLASLILNKTPKFLYQIIFSIGIIIVVTLIAKIIFPLILGNIINNLFTPASQLVIDATQSWIGALLVLVGFFIVISLIIRFVKQMNGEKIERKVTLAKMMPKLKSYAKTSIKWVSMIIIILILLFIGWHFLTKYQPSIATGVEEEASEILEKGQKYTQPLINKIDTSLFEKSSTSSLPQEKSVEWINAPYMKENGKTLISVAKKNGIVLSSGHYWFEIQTGKIRWTYNKSAKTWEDIKNDQGLKLNSTAYFCAKDDTAQFRVQKQQLNN